MNYTKLIHAFLARKCTSNNLLPSKLELFVSHKSSSCYTSFFLPLCVALYLPQSSYQSASSLLNRDNLLHLCPSSPGNAQHTVDIQYFVCQSIGKKIVILSTTLLLGTQANFLWSSMWPAPLIFHLPSSAVCPCIFAAKYLISQVDNHSFARPGMKSCSLMVPMSALSHHPRPGSD